jgi:hypothetical protein
MKARACIFLITVIFMLSIVGSYAYAADTRFIPFEVGKTFTYVVEDNAMNTWNMVIKASGMTIIPPFKIYYEHDERGYEEPGEVDMFSVRSTSTQVYVYDGFGKEHLVWQKAPFGTKWTYKDRSGETEERSVEADNETVNVSAGTFEGCYRYLHKCISCNPPVERTREWVKPGFFMVKEEDYATENAPVVKKLKSWTE